jgi:hypothetical protein
MGPQGFAAAVGHGRRSHHRLEQMMAFHHSKWKQNRQTRSKRHRKPSPRRKEAKWGCTKLDLPLDEMISSTSGSLSTSSSGASKSSSYSSVKSVKSKRKKILLFQAGDDTARVGRHQVYREKARLGARGARVRRPVLPGGDGGREE